MVAPPKPKPKPKPNSTTLIVKGVKVTTVVEPEAILELLAPEGISHVRVCLEMPGRAFQVLLTAKGIRKAQKTIRETPDPPGVGVMFQGRLMPDGSIGEAGLSAQPRKPRLEAAGNRHSH